jgi:hypothetical protein
MQIRRAAPLTEWNIEHEENEGLDRSATMWKHTREEHTSFVAAKESHGG